MSGTCSRCGRVGEMDYGTDGLAYCSSCAFYGLNRQCWRCRMYLPASELQQYNGQWSCPYCIQDLRDADRHASEYREEKHKLEAYQYVEQCERCGRDLEGRVYIWNGRRLCKKCLEHEQESWGLVGGGPMHSPQKISFKPEQERKNRSLIESVLSEFLGLFGLKRKPKIKEVIIFEPKMPIERAKPMAESRMEGSGKDSRKPKAEGIMTENKEEFFEKPEGPDKEAPEGIELEGAEASGTKKKPPRKKPARKGARRKEKPI
ncbi:MAG: hypothetical protein U0R44_03560 [Candidatus Micrarchaeia archaeon]